MMLRPLQNIMLGVLLFFGWPFLIVLAPFIVLGQLITSPAPAEEKPRGE